MIFAAVYLAEDIVLWFASRTGFDLRKLRFLVFTVLLVPLALTSLRLVWVSSKPDTRSLAVEWIQESISPGETILLNFPLTTLLPTDDTIARQNADFPGSIGTQWQWLRGRENMVAPRFNLFNTMYWNSLHDSAAAKDKFIERAGIRYLLVRTQVHRPARDEIILYAQANGRLVRTFCPAYDVIVAELPDDMFYHVWLQVWQLERLGPFVAIYDLHQPPDDPHTDTYCDTREKPHSPVEG